MELELPLVVFSDVNPGLSAVDERVRRSFVLFAVVIPGLNVIPFITSTDFLFIFLQFVGVSEELVNIGGPGSSVGYVVVIWVDLQIISR